MPEYKVITKVVKQKGKCRANHSLGQEFEFGVCTPKDFCCMAFAAIWPTINLIKYGGGYPWERVPDKAYWSCPDIHNTVTFEIRRVEASADGGGNG